MKQKPAIDILTHQLTRQYPQGGGREALSNRFWFLVNAQYEYNWIRLRQLTYLGEIPKMDQNWDPSAGPIPPKVRFRRSIFGTFADLAGRRTDGAAGRTLAPGGPGERNRRFAQ